MLLRPLLQINTRPHQLYSFFNQVRNVRPTIKIGKDKFQLLLDVHQFEKDEIRVKARPEYVIIEGKQERKTKDGYVIRKFIKKYRLPDGCNPLRIRSELSSDGCLIITAPRETCGFSYPCETVVPITEFNTKTKPCDTFVKDIVIDKPKSQPGNAKEPPKP
ncbi:unnamed protein product [Pieris macdunnoughi]|uniref:SHSP domain-containing protein n=1 Tax=Pieris macdunnoughi TaxID=345717 RepID=A0A821WAY9_9NEOP|nr:unnamed protein product [Pieris macdunnoughi]